MITPPDETYSTAQAASLIGLSERQCARYLAAGLLKATRRNGRWRVTALAIWQHLGIQEEMMRLWLEYCRHPERSTAAVAESAT
jgi:predicted site-specific integrase-resolvase